ncbi:probable protein phosphatase [Synechocystis sp. LKSZ1]
MLLSEALCGNCGAVTGKILTILFHTTHLEREFTPDCLELYEGHIDIGQRYRIFRMSENSDTIPCLDLDPANRQLVSQVVDCQPLQPSILKILLSQAASLLERIPNLTTEEVLADPLWQNLGLPVSALPYFKLRELGPKLPEVYDAWSEGNSEFVLLLDRHRWPLLEECLQHEGLPILQLVFWINQGLLLWKALAPLGFAQSLLTSENIRIDEDQNLALIRLYADPTPPPTLGDFAQQLKTQFTQPPQVLPPSFLAILEQLIEAEDNNVDGALAAIEVLVNHLEPEPDDEPTSANPPDIFADFEAIQEEESSFNESPSTIPDTNLNLDEEVDDLPTAVLPMQLMSLSEAGYTDRGTKRAHNEDYFGVSTQLDVCRNNHGKTVKARGVYIVCDGMGGHAAGEVASELAVKTLQEFFRHHWQDQFPSTTQISEAIALANQAIYTINQANASSGSGRMGTTMVMALIQDNTVAIAHVGDSRIYRVTRKSGLEQLTIDHEVGQQAIQNGLDPVIAYSRPDAYQLTQALGPHDNAFVQPDIRLLELEEDSLLLLCSDGISDNDLLESYWETYLLPLLSSSQDLERGLRKLMEFANEYNGHDNLTGVLIRVKVRPQIPIEVW